jgi:hypothetical protein
MKDFFARHSYLVVWVLALVIFGSLAYAILQLNFYVPTPNAAPSGGSSGTAAVQSPAIPPPSVNFFIQKAASGNSFVVQWENLPNGTVALNILRSTTGQDNWTLWKTVTITPDELDSGNADLAIGTATEAGYSFEVEAVSGNASTTGVGNSSSTSGQTVLWTSSSTIPVVTTSTPPEQNPPSQNPPGQNPPPQSTPSSTSSSTNPSTSSNPSSSSSSSENNSSTSQTPSGIPYYNPQVQITAYGNAPGSFWVSHVNQSIEIGWQNIPEGVDTITVARSASSTGPWSTIIIQNNPGTSGSYSLQIVDDTIDEPYYYQMTALDGTTTIATYGPAYLDPSE